MTKQDDIYDAHTLRRPAIRSVIAERVSRRGFLLGSGATLGAVAAQGFVGSLFRGRPTPRKRSRACGSPS